MKKSAKTRPPAHRKQAPAVAALPAPVVVTAPKATAGHGASPDERFQAGKAVRDRHPRPSHAAWKRPATGRIRSRSCRPPTPSACRNWCRSATGACCNRPSPSIAASAGGDGGGPGADAEHRAARAGLRRLPPDEFRRLRHARTQHHLRHQRFRRDAAGALGMGREAPGRLLRAGGALDRALGRGGARCGGDLPRAAIASGCATLREMHAARCLVCADRPPRMSPRRCPGDRRHARARRVEKAMRAAPVPSSTSRSLAGVVGGQPRIRDAPPLIFHPEVARAPEFKERAGPDLRRPIARRWPMTGARCSTAIGSWMRRSRWWASAASGGGAGSC